MKKFVLILLFFVISCTGGKNENVIEKQKKPVVATVTQKINWNEEIMFSECQKKGADNFDWNIKEVQEALDIFNDKQYRLPHFITEYCTNKEKSKYTFISKDKVTGLGRYDSTLNLIEESDLKFHVFQDYINPSFINQRTYGDTSLEKNYSEYLKINSKNLEFGKRKGRKIIFHNKGVGITGSQDGVGGRFINIDRALQKAQNRKYCKGGVTPGGKLSVCFADVYYSYDYLKNTVTEDKVCSFYIDDNGENQILESCREFEYSKGGYELIKAINGVELFQSKNKEVSIIDVDLKYGGVSFGGLVHEDKFYKKYYAKKMEGIIAKPFTLFGVVNGAFFLDVKDKNRTGLSFPIKSEGIRMYRNEKLFEQKEIKENFIDNEIPKATLVITKDGDAKIFEGYKKEYLENEKYSEVSVAFSPDVTARRNAKIGRSYIGLKCQNNICNNMIFFIAENKNQADMDKIIAEYGVKRENIIMMDGGPSAQFSYIGEDKTFYGKWGVPQFNIIYEKH